MDRDNVAHKPRLRLLSAEMLISQRQPLHCLSFGQAQADPQEQAAQCLSYIEGVVVAHPAINAITSDATHNKIICFIAFPPPLPNPKVHLPLWCAAGKRSGAAPCYLPFGNNFSIRYNSTPSAKRTSATSTTSAM